MKLTVQYEKLSDEEVTELRESLSGYVFKVCRFNDEPTLFVGAAKEDVVNVLTIATRLPYKSLLLSQS